MNKSNKGVNEEIFDIEKFLRYAKHAAWNGITTKTFSDSCINFLNEIKDNRERGKNDKTERMIDILVNKMYQFEESNIPNLGRQAINDWIFENIIYKELNNDALIKYFKLKNYLDPWVFLIVTETIREYVQKILFNIKLKKIEALTIDEIINIDIFNSLLQNLNTVKKHYLFEFFSYISPNDKIDAKVDSKNEEIFHHPLVEYCEVKLRKKGDKETSIKNNLTSQIKRHFKWICKNLKEFDGYNINTIIVNQIRPDHLKYYKNFLIGEIKEGRVSELGTKRHFQYVKGFYSMLYSENKIIKDIGRDITNIVADDYIFRDIPKTAELEKFYEVIQVYSQNPLKEKLTFLLMSHLGFRSVEVSKLRWEDINIDNKTISILGKGDYSAILPIPTIILENLLEIGVKEFGYVFSADTENFKHKIYENYKLYSMIAGWRFMGGPHLLRHTYITNLSKYCSIRELKILSRHESSRALTKYVHIDKQRLTKFVNMIRI